MFSKILVAVDLESATTELMARAIALAKSVNARLKLVNVLTTEAEGSLPLFVYPGLTGYPPVLEDSIWQDYQARYQEYQEAQQAKLQRLVHQTSEAGVPTEFYQDVGSPGSSICEMATRWEAELILVGSRGRKGLSELFLGSVSNYVMHHAPCSVMVVHPQKIAEVAANARDLAVSEKS
ncbi:MAG: universal stress protein [Cyanobacteria bacterium J06555_13]